MDLPSNMVEADLLIDKGRSLEELAEVAKQFGPGLDNSVPLKVLYRIREPKFLTPEEIKAFPVPEWSNFAFSLGPVEKGRISRAIGGALRAKIITLAQLRVMDELTLAELLPHGTKVPIGRENAKFLKTIF